MSALFSFLGGSVFRALWGEISAGWTKYQDHKHELELLKLQSEIDDAAHKRSLEQLQLQSTLGIKVIEAKSEAAIDKAEADAWGLAVAGLNKPTGIAWLDIVRGLVQPLLAYIAIIIWVSALQTQGWHITDWDKELVSAIFGMYLANRHLNSRGK